jgi:hypothetical protein
MIGTLIRRSIVLAPDGVDPRLGLPGGYYRVRHGDHWRVARWEPQANRWTGGAGLSWPRRQWDEIREKVA